MGGLLIFWLTAELFLRKRPLPERMKKAGVWAVCLATLATASDLLQQQQPGPVFWGNLMIAVAYYTVIAVVIYWARLAVVTAWARMRKKPASQD